VRSPIELIALDIDGTLVDSQGAIPEANLQAIDRAKERGVRIVLATGRSFLSTMPIARQLNLDTPLVCDNGALIRDMGGNEWWSRRIELDVAREIAAWADAGRHALITVVGDHNYYTWPESWARANWQPRSHDRVVSSSLDVLAVPPLCIMAVGEGTSRALLEQFTAQPRAKVRFDCYKQDAQLFLVVAVHPAASKKNALALLCTHWGLSPSQVMAVGDNLLDLEMLCWAGVGVTMDNAPPEMRERAQRAAPSNDEAGVAWAIERFVLDT
jgi:Cof subfamily protein (haloacid dehalogenase superfamily)